MNKQNIEAILPLSPTQNALVLHAWSERRDQGFVQVHARIEGELDAQRLARAWDAVVARHLALRMSLHAPEGMQPRLVAWRRVEAPWASLDWSARPEPEQALALQEWCAEDRERGLPLSAVPLWRVQRIRLGERRHHLVWSCHHLLIDGWSTGLVLRDLATAYHADPSDAPPSETGEAAPLAPPVASVRDHLAWRKQQDSQAAFAEWRAQLEGFGAPTPLPFDRGAARGRRSEPRPRSLSVSLSAARNEALEAFVARAGLTTGAVVSGAWARLLAHHAQSRDVVFGSTVSGRAADLPGVEEIVGMLSHVVPLRIRIPRDASIEDWLRTLRDRQFASQAFEHVSLAELVACGGELAQRCEFESLLIFENLPARDLTLDARRGVSMEYLHSSVTSTYPLTIVAIPGRPLTIRCLYDEGRIAAPDASRLLEQLCALLEQIAAGPQREMQALDRWLDAQCERTTRVQAPAASPDVPETDPEPIAGSAAMPGAGRHARGPSNPPRNALERRLAELWCELLEVDRVGVDDDFFALGGHSLLSMRLIAEIEKEWGKEVPLSTFFRNPTVAHFARVLGGPAEAASAAGSDAAGGALTREQRELVESLHETLAQPRILSDSRFGFTPGWHWRRKLLSVALGSLAYPHAHRLLAQIAGRPWARGLVLEHKARVIRSFLDAIDARPAADDALERALLCGSLLEYRVGPWGTRPPSPECAREHLTLDGFERVAESVRDGRGVVLVTCHDNALFWLSLLDSIDASIGGLHLALDARGVADEGVRNALLAHQLDRARRKLSGGGVVSVAGDGHQGSSEAIQYEFHGRRRSFRTGFAELTLAGNARAFALFSRIEPDGSVRMRLSEPLDSGDATLPHEQRIRRLVDQFVALHRQAWAEAPWMIPWPQMTRHLAYPAVERREREGAERG